jgi:hypothetical protein
VVHTHTVSRACKVWSSLKLVSGNPVVVTSNTARIKTERMESYQNELFLANRDDMISIEIE